MKKSEYNVVNHDGFYLSLLDHNNELKEDVSFPEDEHLQDVVNKIKDITETGRKECIVTVTATLGKELITDVKEG